MRLLFLLFLICCWGCVSQDSADQIAGLGDLAKGMGAKTARPLLLSSLSSLNFSAINAGSSQTITISIINSGSLKGTVSSSISIVGNDLVISADHCSEAILNVGDTCTLALTFSPTNLSSYSGKVILNYEGGGSEYSLPIPYSGEGTAPQPHITSSPVTWDYGSVNAGSTLSKTFIIANSGAGIATMDPATVTGTGFSITSDLCNGQTLAQSATCLITVDFNPLVPGSALGQLSVIFRNSTSMPTISTVSLSGIGNVPQPVITLSPSPYNFGNVATNSYSQQTFTVSNNTSVSATMGTASVSGSGFTITGNNCNSIVLGAGANCTITVRFTPPALGSVNGTLIVPYNSAQGIFYSSQVNFGATGSAPVVAFSFTGFSGNPATDSANLTATGVRLQWSAQTAASYYQITRTGGAGGTVTYPKIFPTSTAIYNVTGLDAGASYQFKINAFDSNNTSDGNDNWVTITTPNVTGATFNGWSDVVALGSVYTDIGLWDNVQENLTTSRLEWNLSQVAGFDASGVDTVTGNINVSINPFQTGQRVTFRSHTSPPGGLINETNYYVISVNSSTIQLTASFQDAVSGNPIIPVDTGSGYMTVMPTAVVKLGWDTFTLSPSGTPQSYNIYRSSVQGSGHALIGNSSTNSFHDYTVNNETKYYYYVIPVVSNNEVTPASADDSEIEVYVPPRNMALLHRWIVNREACTALLGFSWPSGVNRSDNYSCAYTWGAGYAPNTSDDKMKWDLGYSFAVDRWQTGCKFGAWSGSVGTTAPSAGMGSSGQIYYRQGSGFNTNAVISNCYYKDPTLGWITEGSFSDAQRLAARTNYPGYSLSGASQPMGHAACQLRNHTGLNDSNGKNGLRLFRMQEATLARAVQGVNVNNRSSVILGNVFSGLNLPLNGSCNISLSGGGSQTADGVANSDPSTFPKARSYLINGSKLTKNCHSRYEVSNLWDFSSEWTNQQFYQSATGNGVFINSLLDPANDMLEDFKLDGTTMGASTAYNVLNWGPFGIDGNVHPLFGIRTVSANTGMGTRYVASAGIDFAPNSYNLHVVWPGVGSNYVNGVLLGSLQYDGTRPGRYHYSIYPTVYNSINYGGTKQFNFRCVGEVSP